MMGEMDANLVADFERKTWDRCADSYIDTFSGITKETIPFIVEAAEVRSGRTVLEIGSGPGHVARALAATEARVTGVDFSADMVKFARRRYPQMTFEEADAEHLPFEPQSFDAVVSNFVVHHLARPEAVFKECHRVLKPGGRFAFAVWGSPEDQSSIGAFFAAVEAHHNLGDLPHGPLFGVTDRAVYEPMLTSAGFGGCRFDLRRIEWCSDALEDVVRGFWVWGDLKRLPQDVQAKIDADLRANARPFWQDGKYVFPHTAFVGAAIRQ